ncbi:MAG TPA: hypothetical protein VHM91_14570 [Verrucomicrobiales bacterium]|jgi:hypothetical protein|nr:hypothetical protein [Verrucomicrobiales bacterium]
MKRHPFILSALLLLTSLAHAGNKSSGAYIGLHAEGDEVDGPKMVRPNVIDGQTHYFRISPELAIRHFDSFRAFTAEDGSSYGAALHLNDEGQRAMTVLCSTSRGRLARTIVNGKALDIIRIDRSGDDGFFIIWSGLSADDLKLIGKKLKRLDNGMPGEKGKKSR